METTLDAKKSFINLRILLVPIAAATLLIKTSRSTIEFSFQNILKHSST
jgi:hypothetical protein